MACFLTGWWVHYIQQTYLFKVNTYIRIFFGFMINLISWRISDTLLSQILLNSGGRFHLNISFLGEEWPSKHFLGSSIMLGQWAVLFNPRASAVIVWTKQLWQTLEPAHRSSGISRTHLTACRGPGNAVIWIQNSKPARYMSLMPE